LFKWLLAAANEEVKNIFIYTIQLSLCKCFLTFRKYLFCQVVSFEEMKMQEGFALHKPLFCNIHPSESLKYFCGTCQVSYFMVKFGSYLKITTKKG
jgi:hypothetical protein